MTRLLVIGLDGGTRTVTQHPDARLRNLEALEAEGARAVLRSTVPPITSAAWASMFTGWNPGRHGMYDFRVLDTARYAHLWGAGHSAGFGDEPRFVTSRRWRGSAVWDLIGDSRTVAISAVPMTYPAWQVNGTMISGFPLPDYTRNHASPEGAGDGIPVLLEGGDDMGGMSDADVARHCAQLVERQASVVRSWLEPGGPDVMVAVFQGTDFAQHRLWKYLDRAGDPLREELFGLYRAIDELIGEARTRLGDEGTVAVVSDHGFGPHPRTLLHTDAVLRDAGLLTAMGGARSSAPKRLLERAPALRRRLRLIADRLPSGAANSLAARYSGADAVEWSQTRAYRYPLYAPAEGVVVNLRGRQPEGCVEPGAEYEQVRDQVIEALTSLRTPAGTRAVQWARRREDVFHGQYLEEAPDVIALLDPDLKGSTGTGGTFAPVGESILQTFSGVHAMEGIFGIAGRGIRPGVDLGERDITDVAPTLLALLGTAPEDELDGTAMTEALEPLAQPLVRAEAQTPDAADPVMSAEEEAALERSLRSLGYIE
jgi:predicted AlkP superfamily phosphohydrolase/phosphomutase